MARTRAACLFGLALLGASLATSMLVQDPAAGTDERSRMAPLAPRSLLLDAVSTGELTVAVGERGHVLLSTDRGRSWRQVEVPSRATLTGVYFHDAELGWVVGHDATILRTRDGGETWERVYHDPEEESPLFDVWFSDANNGLAVGAYGLFLVTSDAGASWERRTVLEYDDYHLHHVARSENGRIYMAAEAGTIYRSDDGGQTWIALPAPYEGSFFGTLPLEGDTLLLFGLRGHLFRSEDAGENWTTIDTGTVALLNRGLVTSDGTVIVVGHEGAMLFSDDGGRSFTLRGRADRQALAKAIETDDGAVLLIGEYGVTRLDGGAGAVP